MKKKTNSPLNERLYTRPCFKLCQLYTKIYFIQLQTKFKFDNVICSVLWLKKRRDKLLSVFRLFFTKIKVNIFRGKKLAMQKPENKKKKQNKKTNKQNKKKKKKKKKKSSHTFFLHAYCLTKAI